MLFSGCKLTYWMVVVPNTSNLHGRHEPKLLHRPPGRTRSGMFATDKKQSHGRSRTRGARLCARSLQPNATTDCDQRCLLWSCNIEHENGSAPTAGCWRSCLLPSLGTTAENPNLTAAALGEGSNVQCAAAEMGNANHHVSRTRLRFLAHQASLPPQVSYL